MPFCRPHYDSKKSNYTVFWKFEESADVTETRWKDWLCMLIPFITYKTCGVHQRKIFLRWMVKLWSKATLPCTCPFSQWGSTIRRGKPFSKGICWPGKQGKQTGRQKSGSLSQKRDRTNTLSLLPLGICQIAWANLSARKQSDQDIFTLPRKPITMYMYCWFQTAMSGLVRFSLFNHNRNNSPGMRQLH